MKQGSVLICRLKTHRPFPWAYALLIVILLLIFSYSLFGEKILYNDGAGWDGEFYRNVAKNFSFDFLNKGYDNFRIQRIFPFFILNIVYSIFSIAKTNATLMAGMLILNSINLIVQIIFFFKLAKLLHWEKKITVLLFACFFFNFYTLKSCGYEPFQTDAFAISLSLISYYYLLAEKILHSYIAAVFAFFTWPLVTIVAIFLILFRKPFPRTTPDNKFPFHILIPIAYLIGLGLISLALILRKSTPIARDSSFPYLVMTAGATALFMFILLKAIVKKKYPYYKNFFSFSYAKHFLLLLLPFIITKIALSFMTNGEFYYSSTLFSIQILIRPLKYPLIFLVNHITYWGIPFVLLLRYFPSCTEAIIKKSPGHSIILFLFLFFALDSESRHIATFIPLLLVPLADVLSSKRITQRNLWILVILQLSLSHFFYPINEQGTAAAFNAMQLDTFPAQRYFMNFGPWLNHKAYLFWGTISIFSFIMLSFLIKNEKNFPLNDIQSNRKP